MTARIIHGRTQHGMQPICSASLRKRLMSTLGGTESISPVCVVSKDKMRTFCFLLISFILLTSACAAPESPATLSPAPPTTPAPFHTPTLALSPTQTLQPVRALPPTQTPAPTDTPTRLPIDTPLPSLTPTLGPAITRTPAPAAQCPKPSEQVPAISLPDSLKGFGPQILAYLNARGSAAGLQDALAHLTVTIDDKQQPVQAQVIIKDVTGDTVPDVVVNPIVPGVEGVQLIYTGAVFVFVCQGGRYESVAQYDGNILSVQDMNQDGVPEIVWVGRDCGYPDCGDYFFIVEWDGNQFADLILRPNSEPQLVQSAYMDNGGGIMTDTDGNGTLELVIKGGVASGNYAVEAGPQRERTDIWAWNGVAFTLARTEYAPPQFRIHAVHDGDDASRAGEYVKALAFYQQAIFDEKLRGYAPGQNALYPPEYLIPDPYERPRLGAYSRYRIMVLHIVQGNFPEAQIVHDTLQNKFPTGVAGHPYVELAAAFWEAYQTSRNITITCGKAIDYAEAHTDEVLAPLGSSFYGYANRDYTPEDLCPFR